MPTPGRGPCSNGTDATPSQGRYPNRLNHPPHFVHLPAPGQGPSGTWAEVALDGIVLLDRNLVLSRRLVEFRKLILDGSMARREIHGQPYWVREG